MSTAEQLLQMSLTPYDGRYAYWKLADLQTVYERVGSISEVERIAQLAQATGVTLLTALEQTTIWAPMPDPLAQHDAANRAQEQIAAEWLATNGYK